MLLLGDHRHAENNSFSMSAPTNCSKDLALYNGGNRSLIVRQAIQVYSDMEDRLDKIEAGSRISSHDGQIGRGTSKRAA